VAAGRARRSRWSSAAARRRKPARAATPAAPPPAPACAPPRHHSGAPLGAGWRNGIYTRINNHRYAVNDMQVSRRVACAGWRLAGARGGQWPAAAASSSSHSSHWRTSRAGRGRRGTQPSSEGGRACIGSRSFSASVLWWPLRVWCALLVSSTSFAMVATKGVVCPPSIQHLICYGGH
jgi:hypothetical protein